MTGAGALPQLDALPRRIWGIETEYGIMAAARDGKTAVLGADAVGREIFRPLIQRTQATSAFLNNGGRLYLDTGAHPEYATAECANLSDLLAQDRAGAEILTDWAELASTSLSKQTGIPLQVHLFKNNLDSAGHSCGCHENYLLYRTEHYRQLVDSLLSYLVTRQIFVGAGARLPIDGETRFCLSQRAFQIDETVSRATTEARPLVNTRDEPHADARLYRRLHVIVGDSNVLETPTWFKVGAMNLLLGAVEAGVSFSDLALADPVAALRELTVDLTGAMVRVALADGRHMSALEIQEEYLVRLRRVFAKATLDMDSAEILDTWESWLQSVRVGKWQDLVGVLDWPTKYALLKKLRASDSALNWDNPKMARIDLAYHELTPGGLHLDQRGYGVRRSTKEQVETAKTQAPPNTRAALRGKVLAKAAAKKATVQVDWTQLRLRGSAQDPSLTLATLEDPFAVDNVNVENLLAKLEAM